MSKKPRKKRIRRIPGDVLVIDLGDGTFGYGRVLDEPLIAFYNLRTEVPFPVEEVVVASIAFVVYVMNYAVTEGIWPIIGREPIPGELLTEPLFFKKDPISGKLTIYKDSTGESTPATREQCEGLECAVVWESEHIEDRLRDYFSGKPNKWVTSLQP